MDSARVRVRFAPSPTGPLHIGGVRTALYNYLFARKHNGDMLLRIEDTDQTRYVPGAENYIIESLRWCGIHFNEGVSEGGAYAPYRQSERKEIYAAYAGKLIAEGNAYYAFDTAESLDTARRNYEAEKKTFQYDHSTRQKFVNSLTLSAAETDERIKNGAPYAIRIKIPENEEIVVNDRIRGRVVVQSSLLDDKVLFKSDGLPTYHLANVVDDHLMKITHVIRGEEWLPSAPLHVLLYRFLGWETQMPEFAHLPLLLKPDGNGKLSKRDGDRLGFPVFPLQWTDPASGEVSSGYRESGYFPDAFINMLALLGWNPGTEQEIFSMQDLIDCFNLDRVGKSGSKFDPDKAKWFNHQYLQRLPLEEVTVLFSEELKKYGLTAEDDFLARLCSMVRPRVNFISEIWTQSSFFFIRPRAYDSKSVKDRWKPASHGVCEKIYIILKELSDFSSGAIHDAVMNYIQSGQLNTGIVMNSLRIMIVGASMGPDLFEIMEMLGRDECLARIQQGLRHPDLA